MKLLTGFIVCISVFVFVSVAGWVDFYPVNDSVLLGTVAAGSIYWAVSLVVTLFAGLLGALVGGVIGGLAGALLGDGDETSFAGCGATVVLIGAALAADILVLLNLHDYVELFPVISLGVAIFISLTTTVMGLLFGYKKKED